VNYCREHGIEFYAVNRNYPEEKFDPQEGSRKIDADIYIDDKNLGGFPGWSGVWEMLNPAEEMEKEAGRRLSGYSESWLKRIWKPKKNKKKHEKE
jgi:hypothetical protein